MQMSQAYKATQRMIRMDSLKHCRGIYRLLRRSEPQLQEDDPKLSKWWVALFGIGILICVLVILSGCAYSQEISDIKIANAIFLSEGGLSAKFPYGIRSIRVENIRESRRICLNTIRNNRRRFRRYGYKSYPGYIQFLASRFCPTTGRNLTQSEKRLNKNWIKNVSFYIKKQA